MSRSGVGMAIACVLGACACSSTEVQSNSVPGAQVTADAQADTDAQTDAAATEGGVDASLSDADSPTIGFQLCVPGGEEGDAASHPRMVLQAAELAGGMWGVGEELIYQNGQSYLYVTDDCSYWVTRSEWLGVFHGTLQPSQARTLTEDLSVEQLATYAGGWSGTGGYFDTPTLQVTDGRKLIQCSSRCDRNPAVPEPVTRLYENYHYWLERLVNDGTAHTGAMRMTLLFDENSDPTKLTYPAPVSWPFEQPPEELITNAAALDGPYYGQVVDDPGILEILGDLRTRRTNDEFDGAWYIPVVDNEVQRYFMLYFRDVTPYEDGEGFLPMTF